VVLSFIKGQQVFIVKIINLVKVLEILIYQNIKKLGLKWVLTRECHVKHFKSMVDIKRKVFLIIRTHKTGIVKKALF
jgi:hypothetical protein